MHSNAAIGGSYRKNGWIDDLLALGISIGICFSAAGLGSMWTFPSLPNWYAELNKPSWNPPNSVFGPVWTTLYTLMALAAWLVWRERKTSAVAWPLILFAGQLILNALWSGIFFALHQPGWAFAEVLVLWLMILATSISFWRVRRAASLMLVPYLAWVAFAAVLNGAIWRLN
jgi:benzodiazapine receptor